MNTADWKIEASEVPPCAVRDCAERGRPQVCPYDSRYHHHGMIHYGTIPTALDIPGPNWRYVCNSHYETLKGELAAHRKAVAR